MRDAYVRRLNGNKSPPLPLPVFTTPPPAAAERDRRGSGTAEIGVMDGQAGQPLNVSGFTAGPDTPPADQSHQSAGNEGQCMENRRTLTRTHFIKLRLPCTTLSSNG